MKRLLVFLSLLSIGVGSSVDCPEKYARFSDHHTFCLPPNKQCDILVDELDEKYIPVILKEHNDYRNRLATGMETQIVMPSSSSMMQMEWDEELASIAQKHSEQCKFQHDCSECRRVPNFSVGQNLYMDSLSGAKVTPQPNWTSAVESWYDEVKYFSRSNMNPFVPSSGSPTYGHFTQAVWGSSWRVGCGYTQYKDGTKFVGLYTCNYGPGGNVKAGRMYNVGAPCSKCPTNAVCGQDYPGLCKMLTEEAPRKPPPQGDPFYCSFNEEKYCEHSVTEGDEWQIQESLSGNSLRAELDGGRSSTVTFAQPFKGGEGNVCFSFTYSKGALMAGQQSSNKLVQRYEVGGSAMESEINGDAADNVKYSMRLDWDDPTKVSFVASVPEGAPTQFFELRDLMAKRGDC